MATALQIEFTMRAAMRRLLILLALFTVVSCRSTASSQRPPGMPQPGITVDLVAPIFFGSGYTAPANLQVSITNGGNVPLRVREIQIESQAMGTYALYPVRRLLNETIAPGETKTVSIVATAYTNVSRLNVNEP